MKLYRLAIAVHAALLTGSVAHAELKAGFGKEVITPDGPIWMAGYASRTAPSEGKVHDLWAKAIAFEDEAGVRSVLVTTDLLGMTAKLSAQTAALAKERLNIPRERLIITSSHTHTGPVLRENLSVMYALDEEQTRRVTEYTEQLPGRILEAIEAAIDDLAPATVLWGNGEAGFAINRRQYTLDGVVLGVNPIGPVDHSVPMIVAKNPDGKVRGVLFGYACHNTTLDFQQICGDYAGFAQEHIENALGDATALFVSGCGADANPHPRRSLELAKQHGDELGEAVLTALKTDLAPVEGPIRAVYEEIELELSEPPVRGQLEAETQSQNIHVVRRAQALLEQFDRQGGLKTTYPYPIQIWQFANAPQITALGGEVVVDYALRLKYELGEDSQFVIGYANDVMAYIPSLRVLNEGGYEADSSMIYYGMYGPWAKTIEQRIIDAIHRLSKQE